MAEHVGMEERGLLRGVIGVGGEGELFVGVGIVKGDAVGRDERRHGEVPGEGGEDESGEDRRGESDAAHGGDYRRS
ncbi:MAG: hypothetical protein WA532_11420 [Candidatus Korobacteraceae bacterium]